ncbi:MAG: hypothetical protein IJD22_00665, partial [Clostridia bacterium]|nr:hypothetical protein [Clostridia bacterium]
MFGYFRFLSQYSDYKAQAVYKNYYCGLCFALDMHYGAASRMLLSYDMTILAVALHAHPEPLCEKLGCVGCGKCKEDYFRSETWKRIAAVNILLAAEKMSDDISDERSFKAAAGALVYKGIIRRARKDYPEISQAVRQGYKAIVEAEKEDLDVLGIGELFAQMMVSVLDAGFSPSDTVRRYVHEIARWLYFIDALDDYDEDLEKKRFNPIAVAGKSYREYLATDYRELHGILRELYSQHGSLIKELEDGSAENEILISIL